MESGGNRAIVATLRCAMWLHVMWRHSRQREGLFVRLVGADHQRYNCFLGLAVLQDGKWVVFVSGHKDAKKWELLLFQKQEPHKN